MSGYSLLQKLPQKRESEICVGLLDQVPQMQRAHECVCISTVAFREHDGRGWGVIKMEECQVQREAKDSRSFTQDCIWCLNRREVQYSPYLLHQ